MRFNTGIAAMMEFVNAAYKWEQRPRDALEQFVLLLAPYAPHLAEEMWQASHSTQRENKTTSSLCCGSGCIDTEPCVIQTLVACNACLVAQT